MRTPFVVTLLALTNLTHAGKPAPDWGFLLPGDYHGDEAPGKPGKGWFALRSVGGQWVLEPTAVYARRIHDPVLDAEGQKSGIRISSGSSNAVALLRGPAFRAGGVATPDLDFTRQTTPRNITERQPLSIRFGDAQYQIGVAKSEVFLAKGRQRTRLADLLVSGVENPDQSESATLQWAGDLDGDGRLDLVISYSGYNRSGACLFLSSLAQFDQLVRQLACHGGVGC